MNPFNRIFARKPILVALAMASTNAALAQEQDTEGNDLEEVVVTGSFIRNSQFTNASPVVSIGQEDLLQSGAANLGEYIRDLPFMENIDIVASVLDAQDGQQDSNSARFNIRGLGVESTLTLLDGSRSVNEGAVAGLLPQIAQRSVDLVLDGGAALYGADAVAGVANIIPYKEFEGLRMRTYYKRTQPGDMEQSTFELMTGLSFSNGLSWVGAVEVGQRTALTVAERPEYLAISDQDTTSNNPGTYTVRFRTTRDPDCGAFNTGAEDLGAEGSFPSGEQGVFVLGRFNIPTCEGQFGEFQDFGRPSVNYTAYNNFTWDVSDALELGLMMTHNYRESRLISSPSTGMSTSNRGLLVVPASHPANPFGASATIRSWRPYLKAGTAPSRLDGNGYARTPYPYYTDTYRLSAVYDIGDTSWQGRSYVGYQQYRRRVKGYYWSLSRIQAGFEGRGGPNGNEYYNPFGSADPRSPNYVAGVTDNSQELMDWLTIDNEYETNRTRLKYFETVFDGDIVEIPMGTIRGAFGFQLRGVRDWDYNDPADFSRDNVATATGVYIDPVEARDSSVRSVFAEIEIPLLDDSPIGSLGMVAAARYEDFYTLGFETAKPKISLIWEPSDTVAMRASYGESFLAPSPSQLRAATIENCTAIPDDDPDPITGLSMRDQPSCLSGNPNLNAEESDLWNIGISWQPTDNLSFDLDYQQIEYYDKIETLVSDEVTQVQFYDFLAATSYTEASYDTSNPAHVADGRAWVLANPNPLVQRDAAGDVLAIIRAPVNYAVQKVDVFNVRGSYRFEIENAGNFSLSLGGNYYDTWEYQQTPTAPFIDALGYSNSTTEFAPPIAKYRVNLGLSWFSGNHSANITTRYTDDMIYDQDTFTSGYSEGDVTMIDSITRSDARYSYNFSDWFNTEGRLTVGITNLFDHDPQLLPQRNGMESRIDDPFGRQFYLSLDFDLDTPWN